MVVVRAGVGGIDEGLHRFCGMVLGAQQLAVMIAGVSICTKKRCTLYEGKNF